MTSQKGGWLFTELLSYNIKAKEEFAFTNHFENMSLSWCNFDCIRLGLGCRAIAELQYSEESLVLSRIPYYAI